MTTNDEMREEYDFTDAVKNPYAKKLKKQGKTPTITWH